MLVFLFEYLFSVLGRVGWGICQGVYLLGQGYPVGLTEKLQSCLPGLCDFFTPASLSDGSWAPVTTA